MEERVTFDADGLQIEGVVKQNTSDNGVVVAHPHPLYGGNMFDFVVESIANAYWENGYSTLKFNFRGVGKSQGHYENGGGEQRDLISAVNFLSGIGIEHIDLAGYSFGTWVISRAIADALGIQNIVFVSPPMGLMAFEGDALSRHLKLVVTGSLDDFAPPDEIRKKLDQWQSKAVLEIIQGADHFYGGFHYRLENLIKTHIERKTNP
ncbi:MAG: alpha/beta hydrolase [Desulfobacterales bacterium]